MDQLCLCWEKGFESECLKWIEVFFQRGSYFSWASSLIDASVFKVPQVHTCYVSSSLLDSIQFDHSSVAVLGSSSSGDLERKELAV